ncbi:DUF1223 domain-containing protein [Pseudolysobacter antarcticus]|uniref:DUF1223 domain-containing protein n=1 Tax=Pseudolysobacter antarcticus TaxID=2511995 RepID=A0A411HKC2_9GAMM|nr:DUF1223 domain-containing protein [Pseudolysobacter antarcticus]QBB70972.1 DUF1223 domain-containing protein [Pseudolysobacter antarcticus]
MAIRYHKTRLGLMIYMSFFAGAVNAACVAQSPEAQQKVIELYTSEGCSSCPPADHWMSLIKPQAAIALAFHVDYWDSSGWRDRFDSPRYTARQRDLLGRNGQTIYTPEVALNGKEWQGWSSGKVPKTDPAASVSIPSLSLQVEPGNPVQLTLQTQLGTNQNDKTWRAYFAITEDDLHTAVKAGENRGKELKHDHVVRAFGGPYALDKASAKLDFPANVSVQNATVVAFVQNTETGVIAQAVQQPLQSCAVN